MSTSVSRVSAQDPALTEPRLWFAAMAGHFAWTAQLLLSYFVVSLACRQPPLVFEVAGVDGFQLLLIALTVVSAAVALGATLVGFRAWRAARASRPANAAEPVGWRGFLGAFGALLSGIFAFTILMTGLSLLYLDPCR